MVDAGIARKVDFGEGRSRFEPSLPPSAPLSSHLQHLPSLVGVSQLRRRSARRGGRGRPRLRAVADHRPDLRHVRRLPHRHADRADRRRDDRARVRARRAADGDRHRAKRPRVLHARRRPHAATRGAGAYSRSLPTKSSEHLGTLEKRYRELIATDPQLESRPTFLFFKGAASGLFAAGAEQLRRASTTSRRCSSASSASAARIEFFKRYGERFEDSEGKRIFLEFADEEREHLRSADSRVPRAARATGRAARGRRAPRQRAHVDRPPHPHHRVRRPLLASRARRARVRRPAFACSPLTDHDTVAGCEAAARACAALGIEFVAGIEVTAVVRRRRTCTCSDISSTSTPASLRAFLDEQRRRRVDRIRRDRRSGSPRYGMPLDAEAIVRPAIDDPSQEHRAAPGRARAWSPPATSHRPVRRSTSGCRTDGPAFVPRLAALAAGGLRHDPRGRRRCLAGASGARGSRRMDSAVRRRPASTRSRPTIPSTTTSIARGICISRSGSASASRAAPITMPTSRTAPRIQVSSRSHASISTRCSGGIRNEHPAEKAATV